QICRTAKEAAQAVCAIGPAVIKAQVAAGKRGKAGGIKPADTPEEAERVAAAILGMSIGEYKVERVLGRVDGFRYRDVMERERLRQSGLRPANFTTLPHFSVSSAMKLPNSAGEPGNGVAPRSVSRALIFGSANAALISLFSL